jgi:hypothetical protein
MRKFTRRDFLQTGMIAGGGLVLAACQPPAPPPPPPPGPPPGPPP